ncbi:hypothetical protein FIV07_22475 [Mycobacterium sp. THAF192]|nr:hypothetical protein FIV07_22475 [Mycobacterium sp. THAF192]
MAEVSEEVRKVIGDNIERVRRARGLTVRDLSARLKDYGLALSPSGVSDVENATRKVAVDELLVLAIALNTSVIDLLTPHDGQSLSVAEGVEPLQPEWLEGWLQGETPWPATGDKAVQEEYFSTASEARKLKHRIGLRPEIHELAALRSAVAAAIDGPGPFNETEDPEVLATQLRDQLERVQMYVKLLADNLERNGYAAR